MISIFTYYDAINYGAVLQAFAMQEIIREITQDKEVCIVDHCPQAVRNDYKLIRTGSGKALILSLLNYRDNAKRRKIFDTFIEKYMNITSEEDSKRATIIMLGSDQIWNPNISRGFDNCFFGILDDYTKRRVGSYAASIGVSELSDSQFKELEKRIRNVDYVSVREKSAKELIHKVASDIEISVDLDPTLLVSREKWETIAKPISIGNTPYVLVYSLSGYQLTYETVNKVAEFYKARIIEVTIKNQKPFVKVEHQQIKNAGPDEFLWLIKNAAAVVTDSFHGTVFSIIFNRSLFVIPNKTKASRMTELMQKVNLESRIVNSNAQKLDFYPIEYSKVVELLEQERNKSYSNMKSALGVNGIDPNRRV